MESGGRVSHEEDEVANVGGPVATPSNNLEVDALGRTKLRFSGKTFDDDPDGITKVINKIIHSYYDGPWKTFGEVPDVVQNQWWNEFQSKYFWEDFEGPQIKANWRAKCSKHISNTFSEHRSNKTKPKWVSSKHWATMLTYWENDPKFLLKSEISKKNRASTSLDGGSNYAGGSRSTAGYAIKFKKEKGRDINIEELMKETYTNKKTGEFYTERAKICLDRYNIMANEWLETHESLSKEKQDELWFIASGGDKKGYVYGFGSMYCKNRLVLNPRDINPNPSPPLPPPCHVLAASSSSLPSCPRPVLAARSSSTAPPALQPSPRIHDVQFVPPMSAPLVLARAPPPP